jgi:hypothetical protein
MGREIRRVPANWQHPLSTKFYREDRKQPMFDDAFEPVMARWLENFDRIRSGKLDDLERECYPRGLADWLQDEGMPPDPAYYRPWKDEEATWFQLWETVSEGTPVSPPFETEDGLIDYLAANGDEWDQKRGDPAWGRQRAERFVRGGGWAPSMVVMDGRVMSGVEAVTSDEFKPKGE